MFVTSTIEFTEYCLIILFEAATVNGWFPMTKFVCSKCTNFVSHHFYRVFGGAWCIAQCFLVSSVKSLLLPF